MGINYRNDKGEIISKEEFDILFDEFKRYVDDEYNKRANQIVDRINSTASNDLEKLWMLFDYFTSGNMKYDLDKTTDDNRLATHPGYVLDPYKNWKIPQGTKYPALLFNAGVCITYSLAFEDLANRLKIPCRVVSGFTTMEHAWNVVLINNEVKQIDVTFPIEFRSLNKRDFFLKDRLPSRTIESSISNLESDMRRQYAREHPRIKFGLKKAKPTIKIVSKTEDEEPRITIRRK